MYKKVRVETMNLMCYAIDTDATSIILFIHRVFYGTRYAGVLVLVLKMRVTQCGTKIPNVHRYRRTGPLCISQAISSPFYSLDPPHNNMKNLLESCVPNPFGHFLNLEPSQRLPDMYLSPQTTQTKQNHCGSITGIDGGLRVDGTRRTFPTSFTAF